MNATTAVSTESGIDRDNLAVVQNQVGVRRGGGQSTPDENGEPAQHISYIKSGTGDMLWH
jgi:hypothetical protein